MTRAKTIQMLERKCHACHRCDIGGKKIDGHRCNVFSNMCMKSNVVVVGQNPGLQEVMQGKPFVGPSGAFFDKAIVEHAGIERSSFYITNTVKCWTPNNRAPREEEITNCQEFLDAEIEAIQPVLLVALGNPALKRLTGQRGITKHHGEVIISPRYLVKVFPLYHPSPYNTNKGDMRKDLFADLNKMGDLIRELNG